MCEDACISDQLLSKLALIRGKVKTETRRKTELRKEYMQENKERHANKK